MPLPARQRFARLAQYVPDIRLAAKEYGEDPFRVGALILRESWAGAYLQPKGPGGKGDHGHGHGLCQIDDRTWGPWLKANEWWIPLVNIRKGCSILRENRGYLRSLAAMPGSSGDMFDRTVYAAYNCGPTKARRGLSLHGDPDWYTADSDDPDTRGDYSIWVWGKTEELRIHLPALGAP